MLNAENNRFPNSAQLFIFCKEILSLKKGKENRVTDQDVGALLDFDPSDCTHWKQGRKEIKSIQSINRLANILEIDAKNLIDLVQNRKKIYDILPDYIGYGSFSCTAEERTDLLNLANNLVNGANIQSLPVQIHEIISIAPEIILQKEPQTNSDANTPFLQIQQKDDKWIISWPKSMKMGVYLRFLIAKEFAKIILPRNQQFLPSTTHLRDDHFNMFAMFLLTPSHLLKLSSGQCDPTLGLVEHISQNFWIGRSLVNVRLKDFLKHRD